MRFKRRYFCIEIAFQDYDLNTVAKRLQINKLRHNNLSDTLHKSIEGFYGDYGMATMMPSFSVIYFNLNTNLAILRTARDLQTKFQNLLTFTRKIEEIDVAFRVIHVSGSIRKCKKFLLDYCNLRLLSIYQNVSSDSQAIQIKTSEQEKEVVDVLERIVQACQESDNVFNFK